MSFHAKALMRQVIDRKHDICNYYYYTRSKYYCRACVIIQLLFIKGVHEMSVRGLC